MHWYWAPILGERVRVTPELATEMVRRNTMTTGMGGQINKHCNVPEGMVFLTRNNFGLAGLGAAGPWRAIVEEYVDDRPPSTELGRISAATTRGGSSSLRGWIIGSVRAIPKRHEGASTDTPLTRLRERVDSLIRQ